jgi:hypothetical protein
LAEQGVSVKFFIWGALGLAAVLAGCAPGPIIDRLPGELGLPAGAPARPETPYEYPAVHDMPPNRASSPMTEEEQVRLEKELINVRDRQEGRPSATKKAAPTAKKPPKGAQNGQTDGVKANP